MKLLQCLALVLSLSVLARSSDAQPPEIHLLPTPKEIQVSGGMLNLRPSAHIVAAVAELAPLAEVVSGDILKLTGLRLAASEGPAAAGDIVLALDKSLATGEARHWPYTIAVSDRVEVTGGDYNAVAMGTASVLQLLQIGPRGPPFPSSRSATIPPPSFPA